MRPCQRCASSAAVLAAHDTLSLNRRGRSSCTSLMAVHQVVWGAVMCRTSGRGVDAIAGEARQVGRQLLAARQVGHHGAARGNRLRDQTELSSARLSWHPLQHIRPLPATLMT